MVLADISDPAMRSSATWPRWWDQLRRSHIVGERHSGLVATRRDGNDGFLFLGRAAIAQACDIVHRCVGALR